MIPRFTPNMSRRIEILAFPDVQLLDVAGPLQVFSTANDLAIAAGGEPPYQALVVADAAEISATSGLRFATEALPDAEHPVHTLIVAGGRGVNQACKDEGLVAWVRSRAKTATRCASVCSGAFLLASAGVLDGRRAVTHWQRCSEFTKLYPKVRLDPDPIFVRDGTVWTSAGVTAGIDLALALVEEDLDRRMALAIARQLVVFLKRPGGQAQFSTVLALQDDGRFDRLHAWIVSSLCEDLSLPALAAQAQMSPRSFSRHYRRATGVTPVHAVEILRLEGARRLLEQGSGIGTTARRCGFGSEETMRRVFQRMVGVSPHFYRERFAGGSI